MCSRGIPVLIVLSMKTTNVFFHRHQAGSPVIARPADLEVAPGPEGVPIVEPEGKLRHERWHLLAEIEVETNPFDPEVVDGQGRTGRCP